MRTIVAFQAVLHLYLSVVIKYLRGILYFCYRIGHRLKTNVTKLMDVDDKFTIAGIQGTAAEREQALGQFFRQHRGLRGQVINYVATHGGTEQDGEDVFQDAVVLFDRHIRSGRFEGKSALTTFFFSIAKFHWIGKRRRSHKTEELPERRENESVQEPDLHYIHEEKKTILEQALEQIGEKCQQLLNLYKLDYSMEEIAEALGISSAAMAKKDAYRCRMKLREYLTQRPHLLRELGVQWAGAGSGLMAEEKNGENE
jgi:RNA polymerase sigma factor (sigma-70 family)